MNTLTPEGNKLIDSIVRSHDDTVRAAERERCAKIARSFISWPPATKAGVVVAIAIADAIENNANG